MSEYPGRDDVGAVLELCRLGAPIVLLRSDKKKRPARKWRRRRASARSVEGHSAGYGMRLDYRINRRWEDICVVDIDNTDRSETETRTAVESVAGGPCAAWFPSRNRGWHAVFAGLPGAKSSRKFRIDGIRGEVLSGAGAYVCLWAPRNMLSAVRILREGLVIIVDPDCFPLDVEATRRKASRAKNSGPAGPRQCDHDDGLDLRADLFGGAVGARRTLGHRFPVEVNDDGLVVVGCRGDDLFDQTRAYAYPRASTFGRITDFQSAVLEYAAARTAKYHAEQLPADDVLSTAVSVAGWSWERRQKLARWSPGRWFGAASPRLQAARGRRSGEIRRAVNAARDSRIRALAAAHTSQREIARLVGCSKTAVQNVLARELDSWAVYEPVSCA